MELAIESQDHSNICAITLFMTGVLISGIASAPREKERISRTCPNPARGELELVMSSEAGANEEVTNRLSERVY
jgi:hypothetical protein